MKDGIINCIPIRPESEHQRRKKRVVVLNDMDYNSSDDISRDLGFKQKIIDETCQVERLMIMVTIAGTGGLPSSGKSNSACVVRVKVLSSVHS